jgi:hypothetical protein
MDIFPGRIIDSVNGFVGKVKLLILKTVTFNPTIPSILEFKDQDGGILDSVQLKTENIEGLDAKLDVTQKLSVVKIPISDLAGVDLNNIPAVTTAVKNWMNSHVTPIADKQFIAIELVENDMSGVWDDSEIWNDTDTWIE